MGPGFLERAYQEAVALELEAQGIAFQTEVPFSLQYAGQPLRARYRADLVCFGSVLVEMKAQPFLGRVERAQVENYLRCSNLEIGLLLNFGRPSLQFARILNPANPPRFGEFRGA